MKRGMMTLIFLVSVTFVTGDGLQARGQETGSEPQQGERTADSPEVKIIKQLLDFFSEIAKEKDEHKLQEKKWQAIELIRENLRLTVQVCGTLLDEGIRSQLAGDTDKSKTYFLVGQVLAERYEKAIGSHYLTDKVRLFGRWGKIEKEKYLEAEKFYGQGEEACEKYCYDTAVPLYNQGLVLYREINYKEGEANCLKSLGNVYRVLSENAKARESYEKSLIIFRKIKDRLGEANCLRALGDVHYVLSENEKARGRYEQGLAIFREIKDRTGEADCLYRIGELHRVLSEYKQARETCVKGLVIYQELKDRLGEANSLRSLGDVHYQLNESEPARESYKRALAIYDEIKDRLGKANTLKSIGEVHFQLSEYEQARDIYEQGLAIYHEIKARFGEANTLRSLGDVHYRLAQFEKARERYEQGLTIAREIKNLLGEANTLRSLGDVLYQLAEYEKAQVRYEQGLEIFRKIKDRVGEANTLRDLGDVHLRLNKYERAREQYEQGLVIAREINNRLGEANCLLSLGNVHLELTEYENAQEKYGQGLAIFRKIKDRSGEANCLHVLGDVKRLLAEFEKARQYYEAALSIQREIGVRHEMSRSYYGLGKTFEAMNNFPAAEKEYLKSIAVIEEVWEDMKREEFKSPYFTSRVAPYENLILLLFNRGKGTRAFTHAERSKARSFLYLLGNKRIDIKKGAALNLVRQEEELRQKITTLTRKIMENKRKKVSRRFSPTQIGRELLQLKQTHSEILGKMKLLCPEYATLVSVNPLSPEEIQSLILDSGDTVFLEYYTTPGSAYLWVLDGKDIYPYEIAIDSDTLVKKVREYYTMIANPGTFGVATLEFQARELYNLLLKPAETHWAGKTRIGIIPHGILHYLPFEALVNNGKFLAEQGKAFFYLPSASVYKFCRDKNSLKKEQFIALGNPDGTLSFSQQEVKGLKDLYNINPKKIFIGKYATETKARSEGPYADILHFSCHGVFDSVHPMYSALKLAADDKEDGNLEVQDIFQMALKPAYLVTLSACQTHVGSIKSGDEIVVISRAFMYAGTPSVLASLWPVNDYYTEKLMVSFYRALKKNDKITALHLARKEMMEKYGKRHPFYWAPFVLIGDFR